MLQDNPINPSKLVYKNAKNYPILLEVICNNIKVYERTCDTHGSFVWDKESPNDIVIIREKNPEPEIVSETTPIPPQMPLFLQDITENIVV